MNLIVLPINGKKTAVELKEIEIDKLQLDDSNPRISFFKDNQLTDSLDEKQIIYALINKKPEAFKKLKDSIQNNKGVIYPIWVESLEDDRFKIVEGNSRVVVYKQLRKEEPNEEQWNRILSYILPVKISDEQKNFIRLLSHLRGTTEWDAYEKAKYLYKLWEIEGWPTDKLEKQTKLTEKEIKESIDAYRIMEEQYLEIYRDDPNEVSKFSYFVEFVKDKKLQKIMKENSKSLEDFCNWVSDKEKLTRGEDVRLLRHILADKDARDRFLNKGFEAARQILELRKPNIVSYFYRDVENVIEKLKNMSAREIDEIISEKNGEKEKMIKDLTKWSSKILKLIDKEINGI